MNLITILYYLFIRPLELLFETVFALANRKLDNPVLCIVVLSLVVNFLVLPLYKRADALQAEERAKEKSLEKWVNHIKKTFSGDERFLMLQYYYKQNDYKPIYALKSSVSLLLQIPFFIAAYRFLSQLALLRGLSFGPIADLSQPDALFTVGGFTINVLPIAMTLINIISGTVYSKGLSAKLKVQLYGVALVFLVLLYTSPAGLVFYWLLNNLFSLLKNVVFKLYEAGKGPKLSLPRFDFPGVFEKSANAIFWGSALFMAVFTGAFIPSNVIVASAEEFMDLLNLQNPAIYMAHALCLALGTFVVWCGVYYLLTEKSGRLMFAAGMWMMAGVAVLDYMAFGRNLGLINDVLQYEKTPVFSLQTKIINLLLVVLVALVLFLLYKKQQKLVRMASVVLLLAVTVITGINVGQMTKTYRATADSQGQDSLYAEIPLSRTGKNVVLIMLDRALSLQVPYIFKEKPELYEDFDGFTYYSNVLSFGPCTSVGISGLYGGYEYTPEAMEKRDDEYMWQKHNESLKVMPDLFYNAGYNVTICDPTYAGYSWIPDLTIYKDYPDMHTYYMDEVFYYDHSTVRVRKEEIRNRNFFYYGLTKIAPVFMQSPLYNEGLYNEIYDTEKDSATQRVTSPSTAEGLDEGFMKGYTVMEKLPEISKIEDDEEGTFLLLSSNMTHETVLLQKPDYVPVEKVDNTEYDAAMAGQYVIDGVEMKMETEDQQEQYSTNMAAYLELAKWFRYMKEQGVYDNTRIILVSDHGWPVGQFGLTLPDGTDTEKFRALLMVKDFDATGFTTDDTFMTNADVPVLTLNGLVEDPVNPFTKKKLTMEPKKEGILISDPDTWVVSMDKKPQPGKWYSFVGDNASDMSQWEYVGEH